MSKEKSKTYLDEFVKKVGRLPMPAEEDLLSMIDKQVSSTDYLDKVIKAAKADREELKPEQPVLSEVDKKKLEDYEATGRKFEQEAKDHKLAEEKKAKTRELEDKGVKDIKKWTEGFYGETSRHKEIRDRLYKINEEKLRASPKRIIEIDAERLSLLAEYKALHYEVGTRTFNKVIVYQNITRDMRLTSEDNGHSWIVSELIGGQWAHGQFKLILKEGKPAKLTTVVENLSLYDFIRQGMNADFNINLKDEPDKPELPKTKLNDWKITETFPCPVCGTSLLMGQTACPKCGTPMTYRPPSKQEKKS